MNPRFSLYSSWLLLCAALAGPAAAPAAGAAEAAQEIAVPAWFKASFLDLRDDVSEAAAAGKRTLIYFGQNGCPYCTRLMEVNFKDPAIVATTRRHFDVIELNILGSRSVTWFDGKARSEKELAAFLKVQFTPTLLFLDEKGAVALRVNGYYPPPRFAAALEYVAGRYEKKTGFAEFQKNQPRGPDAGAARSAALFRAGPYSFDRRTPAARPLAVFFEQRECADCDDLHAGPLAAEATRRLLARFDAYRLDVQGAEPVVTPDGAKTTAAGWARTLNIQYTPGIVFFDERGREVLRVDAYLRSFHLQSALDYVASGAYLKEPSLQRFIQARAEAVRARGGRVNLME
jgi:thioredoxin-related protein